MQAGSFCSQQVGPTVRSWHLRCNPRKLRDGEGKLRLVAGTSCDVELESPRASVFTAGDGAWRAAERGKPGACAATEVTKRKRACYRSSGLFCCQKPPGSVLARQPLACGLGCQSAVEPGAWTVMALGTAPGSAFQRGLGPALDKGCVDSSTRLQKVQGCVCIMACGSVCPKKEVRP